MKKLFLLSAFILLNVTLFSCTTEDDSSDTKSATEIKKVTSPKSQSYADGPGDIPINPPPPPAASSYANGPDDDPIKVPPPPTKD